MALIHSGDQVIIYSSKTEINSLIVEPGEQLHSRYGHFKHDEMIGKPFGSKFSSSNGRGFVYLLKPTPELWTLALPHRTQILYLPDIAYITSHLDLKAGSKVIEAGTGSGSFSHSLARTVGPSGKVHSFEYHAERFEKAKQEFKAHKLDQIITLKHQNVYKDGFELVNEVDAVFLDLPAPWEAIVHAKTALRKDRQSRICCFSPCIEQVLKTVNSLSEHGFSDITMFEALTRSHETAPLVAPDIGEAIKKLKHVEAKKEHRRQIQIQDAEQRRAMKRKAEEMGQGDDEFGREEVRREEGQNEVGKDEEGEENDVFEVKEEDAEEEQVQAPPVAPPLKTANGDNSGSNTPKVWSKSTGKAKKSFEDKDFTFKASPLSRGHTSYLTFATLFPSCFEGEDWLKTEEVIEERGGELPIGDRTGESVETKPSSE